MSKENKDHDNFQDLTAGSALGEVATSTASAAISTVKKTVAGPESESRKWRRSFESYAKEVNGQLYVYQRPFGLLTTPVGFHA